MCASTICDLNNEKNSTIKLSVFKEARPSPVVGKYFRIFPLRKRNIRETVLIHLLMSPIRNMKCIRPSRWQTQAGTKTLNCYKCQEQKRHECVCPNTCFHAEICHWRNRVICVESMMNAFFIIIIIFADIQGTDLELYLLYVLWRFFQVFLTRRCISKKAIARWRFWWVLIILNDLFIVCDV